jgi:hypothetical protein
LDEQLDKPVGRASRLVHPKAKPEPAADDRGGPDPRVDDIGEGADLGRIN